MKVEEIMTSAVGVCAPADPLETAARIMWDRDCGCVPVVASDDGQPRVVGMITDRDICMAAMHRGERLGDMQVASAMSPIVFTCRPDDPIELAVKILQERQIHRLPVVDAGDRLVGIVSLADVAREAQREHTDIRREVTDFEVAETVEAICVPREATVH